MLCFHCISLDDFTVVGTDELMIDAFGAHIQAIYDVTSNMDGDFLGIHIEVFGNGSRVLTKPHMLQTLVDKVLLRDLHMLYRLSLCR